MSRAGGGMQEAWGAGGSAGGSAGPPASAAAAWPGRSWAATSVRVSAPQAGSSCAGGAGSVRGRRCVPQFGRFFTTCCQMLATWLLQNDPFIIFAKIGSDTAKNGWTVPNFRSPITPHPTTFTHPSGQMNSSHDVSILTAGSFGAPARQCFDEML